MSKKIIGISAEKGGGKTLATKMIQFLTSDLSNDITDEQFLELEEEDLFDGDYHSEYDCHKFSFILKKFVSNLTGIKVSDLDKQEVKNSVLPKEFWYFAITSEPLTDSQLKNTRYKHHHNEKFYTETEAELYCKGKSLNYNLVKPTVRDLMVLIGNDFGRNMVHPNLWIFSAFKDYKKDEDGNYPSWLFDDVRYPNEVEKIHEEGGIVIRLHGRNESQKDRICLNCHTPFNFDESDLNLTSSNYYDKYLKVKNNTSYICPSCGSLENAAVLVEKDESESSLDNYPNIDYTLKNDGSKLDLLNELRRILILEGIIEEKSDEEENDNDNFEYDFNNEYIISAFNTFFKIKFLEITDKTCLIQNLDSNSVFRVSIEFFNQNYTIIEKINKNN